MVFGSSRCFLGGPRHPRAIWFHLLLMLTKAAKIKLSYNVWATINAVKPVPIPLEDDGCIFQWVMFEVATSSNKRKLSNPIGGVMRKAEQCVSLEHVVVWVDG